MIEAADTKSLEIVLTGIEKIQGLGRDELREFIAKVEEEMRKLPQIQFEPKIIHHFSKGVYGREMHLPKGALIVGKIHKFENFNICSKGDVSVLSIDGAFRVQGGFHIVGSSGAKRIIYAHEDTIWTTIHGTSEKDLEKIESEFIATNYEEINQIDVKEVLCLGQQ